MMPVRRLMKKVLINVFVINYNYLHKVIGNFFKSS